MHKLLDRVLEILKLASPRAMGFLLFIKLFSQNVQAFDFSQQRPVPLQNNFQQARAAKLPHGLHKQPNIMIIICDDAGMGDFGFNKKSQIKTPNLDKLANSGTVFNNFYTAAAVCSPSRAGLISGEYVSRMGWDFNPQKPRSWKGGIQRPTLAMRLQSLGYQTAAFGKWHLGNLARYHPNQQGFRHFWGFIGGQRQYTPEKVMAGSLLERVQRNGKYECLNKYLSYQIADEVSDYVATADFAKPQFLWVAFNAPHTPLQAPPDLVAGFGHIEDASRRNIAAMQLAMDRSVARIVSSLAARGQLENTLIWFLSDNGAAVSGPYDNAGLRGHKGLLLEGGIKTAAFASWPKHVVAKRRMNAPVCAYDITATSLALAGGLLPQEFAGIDLYPSLKSTKTPIKPRYLYWRQGAAVAAIRDQRYKLILAKQQCHMLFDLQNDPYEKTNLLEKPETRHLQIAERLRQAWLLWDKGNIAAKWQPDFYQMEHNPWLRDYYRP